MSWWQYIVAIVIILFWIAVVFIGVFEWLALREQNEPRGKSLAEYYQEHEDERPERPKK